MKREGRPVPPELRELSQAADAVIAQAREYAEYHPMLQEALAVYDAAKAKLEDEG